MKYWHTLFFLLSLLSGSTFAQFKKGGTNLIGADMLNGTILKHKEGISHLITAPSRGFRIHFERKTHGDQPWEKRYNYPDLGVTFTYLDYGNEALGSTLGLAPYFGFYLTKNKMARSFWRYKLGMGMGYTKNTYDPIHNNKNIAISTKITSEVLVELDHFYKFSPRLESMVSLSMTHFSNGAIKKPNSGINVVSANLGLRYKISPTSYEYKNTEDTPITKKIGFVVITKGGLNEEVVGGGARPFVILTGMLDKQINHKSRIGAGLEWFHSESLRKEVEYSNQFGDETPKTARLGVFIGHELMVNDFSLISQFGYYLYDPYKNFDKTYVRANLRYYLTKQLFGGIGVKSHVGKAESAEFIIGYRI